MVCKGSAETEGARRVLLVPCWLCPPAFSHVRHLDGFVANMPAPRHVRSPEAALVIAKERVFVGYGGCLRMALHWREARGGSSWPGEGPEVELTAWVHVDIKCTSIDFRCSIDVVMGNVPRTARTHSATSIPVL